MDQQTLQAAHKHAACHRNEILASKECGCFYCETVFAPSSIEEWIEETSGNFGASPDPFTALCPDCGVDSVLGDASPFPATDPVFLSAMNKMWFGEEEAA